MARLHWDLHQLFVRHARDINRFLRRRGHTAETAADLTQDTFVRMLTAQPGDAHFKHNPAAYLFRVSRNLSIDHARRERLLRRADLAEEDFAAIADPQPTAETLVYDRQRLALTQMALAELPERTRRAFELHRLGEMTIAQVAERLGLSTSRSWALIRDAYEHIDARLSGL